MSAAELVGLAALFLTGVVLVIWCVEVFIEAVARSAVSLGISGFFLAVLLAGIDLENAILGVTAAFVDLPTLALGTVFGESLFVLAVAVGVAGLAVPFRMAVPRIYLLLLVLVPLPAFALSLDGTLDWTDGAILTVLFIPLLAGIFWRERRSETTFLLSGEVEEVVDLEADAETAGAAGSTANAGADAEPNGGDRAPAPDRDADLDLDLDLDEFVPDLEGKSGRFSLAVALLAIVGMTVGSGLTVVSAEGIFVALGVSGLAFGATVLSFIASIEELALTVEPVRRGRAHLAVGNVVGSTVFYVTANVGIIALLRPVDTAGAVMTVHWPFLAACLLVVAGLFARGRVTRAGGAALIALYVGYWIANYA
ncbi:sodium:calcium antiporter [Haloterrigena sp. SYSU A558-1]|uniref:Sodium:calcium antiporter n=1 Tax=Haloterrigena gelatinilytica TaxID=2741724 RepID=A0A8J8KE22_9EURY|nr:sodium:calcium antiporter [Haloterrigena gelatinilytica]NUB90808.1 sodium:calcium antiporter [Haloterrigena gelatinilytica]NUC73373.1 sodium:calcium antiporter [Haloterrigena gelatinilytica]